MMMSEGQFLSAARSFDADETRIMRDAYVFASDAFNTTHHTSAALEVRLPSIVLFIYNTEKIARPWRTVDIRELAQESVETLVRFSNAKQRPF